MARLIERLARFVVRVLDPAQGATLPRELGHLVTLGPPADDRRVGGTLRDRPQSERARLDAAPRLGHEIPNRHAVDVGQLHPERRRERRGHVHHVDRRGAATGHDSRSGREQQAAAVMITAAPMVERNLHDTGRR